MGIRGSQAKARLAGRSWSEHHKFKSLSWNLMFIVHSSETLYISLFHYGGHKTEEQLQKKAYFAAELSTETG